ncbi:PepSY-like domain-containing protein [Winogradskyella sp. PC D3.3]
MKNQILILGVLLSIISMSHAQDIPQNQVPTIILNNFNKQFPSATDLVWEMDGSLYNVGFETGWNIDHKIWYNTEGKMIKHIEDVDLSKLPKAVNDKIKIGFHGYSIDDLKQITQNKKVVYNMALKALRKTDWDIVMDSEGNILSKIID